MFGQRHPALIEPIRRWGCYLVSILFHIWRKLGYMFTPAMVNELYDAFIEHGWMTKECKILNPGKIFVYLGMKARYTDRHEPADRMCAPDEIEILYFELDRPDKPTIPHFVAGDGQGNIMFDPWGDSRCVREGKLISKRIFKLV